LGSLDIIPRCIQALTSVCGRFALGPPLGGILYDSFGFHAPFILGIGLAVADFVGRVLIIERKVSVKWGVDPWGPHQPNQSLEEPSHSAYEMSITESVTQSPRIDQHVGDTSSLKPASVNVGPLETERPQTLSSWGVLWTLMRSTRAMVAVVNTFICGWVTFI
jgi:MFS family permease